jgi:molybdate transport system substrate-binding protein
MNEHIAKRRRRFGLPYLTMALVLLWSTTVVSAAGPTPLQIYAAGSISGALTALAKQYAASGGQPVEVSGGPAGVLLERIEHGANVDVYISANMAHPQRLSDAGKSTAPVILARNSLCVMTRPDVGLTSANLLDRLLDPKIKIGTSTPGADPGGDYTWAWFAKADTIHPGARAILEAKAQKLAGGSVAPVIPGNGSAVKYFLLQKKVDAFFSYCSSHDKAPDQDLVKIMLPANLNISADYGMSVLLHSADPARQAAASRFAFYLLTPAAQRVLADYGFIPVAAAEQTP